MKVYAIADSKSGYTICFMLDRRDGKTEIADFVRELVAKLKEEGHELFMDNLFTSVTIMEELYLLHKTYVTGTCRARRGYPDELEQLAAQWAKPRDTPPQGTWDWRQAPLRNDAGEMVGTITSYLWQDSGPAKMMSTRHGLAHGFVVRRVRGFRERQNIPSPNAFVFYGMNMGAVDTADALRAYLSCASVSRKWWMAVFYWVLDVAAVNAWVWCEIKGYTKEQKAKLRQEFQDNLIAHLTGYADEEEEELRDLVGQKRPRTCRHGLTNRVGRYNRKRPPACRHAAVPHWPVLVKYPGRRKNRRCVYCWSLKRKSQKSEKDVVNTPIACEHCGVPLCLKHFKRFHQ